MEIIYVNLKATRDKFESNENTREYNARHKYDLKWKNMNDFA